MRSAELPVTVDRVDTGKQKSLYQRRRSKSTALFNQQVRARENAIAKYFFADSREVRKRDCIRLWNQRDYPGNHSVALAQLDRLAKPVAKILAFAYLAIAEYLHLACRLMCHKLWHMLRSDHFQPTLQKFPLYSIGGK